MRKKIGGDNDVYGFYLRHKDGGYEWLPDSDPRAGKFLKRLISNPNTKVLHGAARDMIAFINKEFPFKGEDLKAAMEKKGKTELEVLEKRLTLLKNYRDQVRDWRKDPNTR